MLYRMTSAREEGYDKHRNYYIEELAKEKEELMKWGKTDTSYESLLDLIILIGRGDPNASEAVAEIKLAHTLSRHEAAGEVFNFCLEHQIVGRKFYYLYKFMCKESFEVMACTIAMLKTGIFTEEDIQEAFAGSLIDFIDRNSPEFEAIIRNENQSKLFPEYNSIFHYGKWEPFCERMKTIFDRKLEIEKRDRKSSKEKEAQEQKDSENLREIITKTKIFLDQIDASPYMDIIAPTLNTVYSDLSTCKLTKGRKNFGSLKYPGLLGDAASWDTIMQRFEPDLMYTDEGGWDDFYMAWGSVRTENESFNYDEEKDIFHYTVDGEDCAIVAAVKGANPDQLLAIENKIAEEMNGKCELVWVPAEFVMRTCDMCGGPYTINGSPQYPNVESDYILVAKGYEKLRVDNNTDTNLKGIGQR